ncbi:MAG: isoprenyl transferase [Thermodesulfobacteriota bacterium]|nr:isoprenyl transferase [Thermodesulfobacteriota bacterium]
MKFKQSLVNQAGLDPARLPRHVAIIMDGNGRWAKKRSLERFEGHRRGVDVIEAMVTACRNATIGYLTLYAFSTENWQRPAEEVAGIMGLLKMFLAEKQTSLKANGIRLNAIGELGMLDDDVRAALNEAIELTAGCDDMVLTLALSYGGRAELTSAARRIAEDAVSGTLQNDDINADIVGEYLYTRDLPDPDLLIRTSGEMRISNFLLWQLAYSEIYVTDTLWPDFTEDEFVTILRDFAGRERRFGKLQSGG